MVWANKRKEFETVLEQQRQASDSSAIYNQQLSLSRADRNKKALIAVHGRNFIQSVEELRGIVSENYGPHVFGYDFWEKLVDVTKAAIESPDEQTLGIFEAKVTYLVNTLKQHPVANAMRGTINTLGNALLTLWGALIAVTGFCMMATAGCFAGLIMGLGFMVCGAIITTLAADAAVQNTRFAFGSQISEINVFTEVVTSEPGNLLPAYGAFFQPKPLTYGQPQPTAPELLYLPTSSCQYQ